MLETAVAPAVLIREALLVEIPPVAPASMTSPPLPLRDPVDPACPAALVPPPELPAMDEVGFGELLLHAADAIASNKADNLTVAGKAKG